MPVLTFDRHGQHNLRNLKAPDVVRQSCAYVISMLELFLQGHLHHELSLRLSSRNKPSFRKLREDGFVSPVMRFYRHFSP